MTDTPRPAHDAAPPGAPGLVRTMGLFALIVYGVGDMVGAGIYVTIGDAAADMGNAMWMAFVASMVAALLTGLSYASIASRYPRAAGAAYVTQRAFHLPLLSYVVGLATTASGLTSMAAGANAFARDLGPFLGGVPAWAIILAFLAILSFINFWGIRESMWANLLCTAVEVGGLLFIVAVGARYWGDVNYLEAPVRGGDGTTGSAAPGALLVLNGAVLTFFSFIGFEDMLNVSEEVKDPVRTVPKALIAALAIATVLYVAMSITAVSVVPHERLANAKEYGTPLAQITNKAAPWLSPKVFTAITLFAVANTALINYIMGSRLLYGMARHGLLPAALGRVHHARRTPHVAVLTLLVVVIALALSGGVKQLATATSLLLLSCFGVVNVALIVLKRRPDEPPGGFEVPTAVPALGALVCLALIVARVLPRGGQVEWRAPLTAAGILAFILVLYALVRPRNVTEEVLAAAE